MLEQVRVLSTSYTTSPRFQDPYEGRKMAGEWGFGIESRGSSEQAPASPRVYGGFSPASTSAGLKPSRKTLGAAHSVLIMTLCRGWYQKS